MLMLHLCFAAIVRF